MKGTPIPYSAAELAWIKARAALPRRELHGLFCAEFHRSDVNFQNFKAMCQRKGIKTGRTGRFDERHLAWNKGQKMHAHPNSKLTQFKKGQEPHNTKFLGHERMNKEGYVEISVAETNPHTGYPRRYVAKHRWLWEQKNGPVPQGHCLKSRDGDKTNTDPENWIAIPRALLPRLNGRFGRGYDDAPPELKPLILRTVELEYAAREAKRAAKSQKES